jgi:hypothetical protein
MLAQNGNHRPFLLRLVLNVVQDVDRPNFPRLARAELHCVSLTAIGSNLEVRRNNWERRIVKRRFVAESRRCVLPASKFALAVRRHGMRVVVLGIMLA